MVQMPCYIDIAAVLRSTCVPLIMTSYVFAQLPPAHWSIRTHITQLIIQRCRDESSILHISGGPACIYIEITINTHTVAHRADNLASTCPGLDWFLSVSPIPSFCWNFVRKWAPKYNVSRQRRGQMGCRECRCPLSRGLEYQVNFLSLWA